MKYYWGVLICLGVKHRVRAQVEVKRVLLDSSWIIFDNGVASRLH